MFLRTIFKRSRILNSTLLHPLRWLTSGSDHFGSPPSLSPRRVVVTGLGLVTPLGVGVDKNWQALCAGRTAVRALQPGDLPESHANRFEQIPCKVIARVPSEDTDGLPEDPRRHARFTTFALWAAEQALHDAEWIPLTATAKQRTGVAIGCGISSTTDIAEAGVMVHEDKLRRISPFFVPRLLMNMAAGAVSISFGLSGPCHSASTACAAGLHAIGDAFQMIRRGDADVMVAGGSESCVDAVSLMGFCRLRALSTAFNDDPPRASRPFDGQRDGFVMGEGSGVLVLEELEHAVNRGATIYAEVRGYGLSGDAFHMTQPAADGIGGQHVMMQAVQQAGLTLDDVVYINAHATSTPIGDEVEQRAIAAVFKERATCSNSTAAVAVSSTKGATGHLLGAAGAVEAVYAVLALCHSMAPPTVNLDDAQPALLANLVSGQPQPLPAGPKAVLTNSFGFGGTNACVLFASPPA